MIGKTIRLTENEFKKIVFESVKEILKQRILAENAAGIFVEFENDTPNIDISKIDINILRNAYRDLILTPTLTVFSGKNKLRESFNDVLPPDDVVKAIIQKFNYDKQLIAKREAYNNIAVYVITAQIGKNDEVIEKEMNNMGYYLALKGEPIDVFGMIFKILQFEPYSQKLSDISSELKNNYDVLYHWTPQKNIDSILANGLLPRNNNDKFKYPPRIYLIKGDVTQYDLEILGSDLYRVDASVDNDGIYCLIEVDLHRLPDNIQFFYDSNSDIGVYTEQAIPKDCISLVGKCKFNKM